MKVPYYEASGGGTCGVIGGWILSAIMARKIILNDAGNRREIFHPAWWLK